MQSSTRSSSHQVWWLVVIGFFGLLLYALQADSVFPFTSIDLKMPRSAIGEFSRQWCNRLGYNPAGSVSSTVFDYDDDAKTFLEYELGQDKANELMKSTVPTWYWSTRFCRPFKLEEVNVCLDPIGNLVSVSRSISNDRPLPSLDSAAAKKLATEFITKQAGCSLDSYQCIEDGSVPQSRRTDHYFTFEDTQNDYKGAKLRIYSYISGNTLTEYKRFLFIPENWSRKFEKLRSYNRSLQDLAGIGYVVFSTASFFTFLWAFASGLLRWRFALCLAAIITVVDIVESINSLPTLMHSYATTMSLRGYFFETLVSAGLDALQQLLQVFIIVGAAEALYRRVFPNKIALEKVVTTVGLATKQVVNGLIAGFGMFGIHLGWIILYYLAGKPFGFWSPMEVRNIEGLSSLFPYFSALYIGASAAILEEFTYRVFGLSLLQTLTKRFWLANILQAAAWAFMHSNYPQEPPYARGLELTVVGVLYGAVLRRYGVIACIASHYLFDVFLGVSPLWSSPLAGMKIGSVCVLVPPLILLAIALFLNARRRASESEAVALENHNIPVNTPPVRTKEVASAKAFEYLPLSTSKRNILAALIFVFCMIQFCFYYGVAGDGAQLTISREQAVAKARDYLTQHHLMPGDRIPVVWLSRDIEYDEMQYIFEKAGLAKARQLAACPGRPLVWYVRFIHPLDETEYWVTLDSTGRPVSLGLVRPEDAAGDNPSRDWSVDSTTDYLLAEHKEFVPFHLDSFSSISRKARTDATVVYDVPKFHIAEAPCKVALNTIGNVVCNYNQYWLLPESWKFERSKVTSRQHILGFVCAALWLVLVLIALWWIIVLARHEYLNWKAALLLALAGGILTVPQALNDLPELFVNYDTQLPLVSYFTQEGSRELLAIFSSMAALGGLLLFGLASFHRLFPTHSFASIMHTGLISNNSKERRDKFNFWLDAVLVGYAAGIGLRAIVIVLSYIHSLISPTVSVSSLDSFCELANVNSCSFGTVLDGIIRGTQFLLSTGLMAAFCAKYLRSFWRYAAVVLVISLISPLTEKYWQDYLLWAIDYIVIGLAAWPVVAKLARQNFIAYFLIGAVNMVSTNIRLLLIHGSSFYSKDIITLSLVLLSPLIYVIMLWYRNQEEGEVSSQ
jgi:hypothetical protein